MVNNADMSEMTCSGRHDGSGPRARGTDDKCHDPYLRCALYGAARRIANALGYSRLITYIREDEPGTSMKASGWDFEEKIRARSWDMPGRRRTDKTEIVRRERWSIRATGADPVEVAWPEVDNDQLAFTQDMRA